MKVAAYQAPLLAGGSRDTAIELIREHVLSVRIEWSRDSLFCRRVSSAASPTQRLDPAEIAISVEDGQLERVLAPLASDTVTIIVGFTEIDRRGRLFNSAAV